MTEHPNLTYIEELAEGDEDFKNKFIDILKNEFPSEVISYNSFLEEESYKEAAEVVHKLKHKLNILSLEEGYRYAVAFEEELLTGKETMKDGFSDILKTITNYLNTI